MVNRGIRMDFVPNHSKLPLKAPEAPSRPSTQITFSNPAPKAPTPKPAPKPPVVKATISHTTVEVPSDASRPIRTRGFRMDFVRRPKVSEKAPTPVAKPTPKSVFKPSVNFIKKPAKKPVIVDDDEPLMSDAELKAALSGFADAPIEEVPRKKPRIFKPAPKPQKANFDISAPVRRAPAAKVNTIRSDFNDFADDAFGVDGFGDDIDRIEAEIEAEAEAEANDFVKEPRPLFEDPLVQLSKAREERDKKLSAEENERLKEEARARAGEAAKRAPYAALYSTKTPFINTANIEKRPLSAAPQFQATPIHKPEEDPAPVKKHSLKLESLKKRDTLKTRDALKTREAARMKKQLARDAEEIHQQAMVMSTPEVKSHNTALIIGIILTILLGAGVGALIYLVFFQ